MYVCMYVVCGLVGSGWVGVYAMRPPLTEGRRLTAIVKRTNNPSAPQHTHTHTHTHIPLSLLPLVQEAEARWAARCRALEEEVELGRRERASLALAAEQARREVRGNGMEGPGSCYSVHYAM